MQKSQQLCHECCDDYRNKEGECWCYVYATLVTRTRIDPQQRPPYQWTPQETLSCHRPNDFVDVFRRPTN